MVEWTAAPSLSLLRLPDNTQGPPPNASGSSTQCTALTTRHAGLYPEPEPHTLTTNPTPRPRPSHPPGHQRRQRVAGARQLHQPPVTAHHGHVHLQKGGGAEREVLGVIRHVWPRPPRFLLCQAQVWGRCAHACIACRGALPDMKAGAGSQLCGHACAMQSAPTWVAGGGGAGGGLGLGAGGGRGGGLGGGGEGGRGGLGGEGPGGSGTGGAGLGGGLEGGTDAVERAARVFVKAALEGARCTGNACTMQPQMQCRAAHCCGCEMAAGVALTRVWVGT